MRIFELDDRSEWCPLSKDVEEDWGTHCECWWEGNECCWCNLENERSFQDKLEDLGWSWIVGEWINVGFKPYQQLQSWIYRIIHLRGKNYLSCPLSHEEEPPCLGYGTEVDKCCWCDLRKPVSFIEKVRIKGWKWALKHTL